MKKCPFCAEEIQDAAIKCRHCGSLLEQPVPEASVSQPAAALGVPRDDLEDVRELSRKGRTIEAMRLLQKNMPGVTGKEMKEFFKDCRPVGMSVREIAKASANGAIEADRVEALERAHAGAAAKATVDAQLKALGGFHQFYTRREVAYLPEVLVKGETIRALTSGFYESNTWLVVVTDQRLLFLDKGMLYGLKQVELPLRQISAISHKTGLMFGELHIATSAGKSIVKNVPKADAAKIAGIVSDLVRVAQTLSAPPVPVATNDVTSQLERLAALLDKGVLTPAEFAAQKAKLLS